MMNFQKSGPQVEVQRARAWLAGRNWGRVIEMRKSSTLTEAEVWLKETGVMRMRGLAWETGKGWRKVWKKGVVRRTKV